MTSKPEFDILDFMPYLLNQAAEMTSREFEAYYKAKYKLLRTEWRVLFHLGRYGDLTAKDICTRARMHKTKVSRAVQALATKRMLARNTVSEDRRQEKLALTKLGVRVFEDLQGEAARFNAALLADFSEADREQMQAFLTKLAQLGPKG